MLRFLCRTTCSNLINEHVFVYQLKRFNSRISSSDHRPINLPKYSRDILRSGGSATDGAIAALLCTSLVNPQSMGLGGGAIFTVMNSSGEITAAMRTIQ